MPLCPPQRAKGYIQGHGIWLRALRSELPSMVWSPDPQHRPLKSVNSHRDGGCPAAILVIVVVFDVEELKIANSQRAGRCQPRDPHNCPRF